MTALTIAQVNGLIGKTGFLVRKSPRNGFFVRHITGGCDHFYTHLEMIVADWQRVYDL